MPIALPEALYKKGAMLEKAGRFVEREGGPGQLAVLIDPRGALTEFCLQIHSVCTMLLARRTIDLVLPVDYYQ